MAWRIILLAVASWALLVSASAADDTPDPPLAPDTRNSVTQAAGCTAPGVWLQVLGSGGPELARGRASSGYLLWHNGVARVLVDVGGGIALRFQQVGADFATLDGVLLTHLHVDHSADLPVLVKASYFGRRTRTLPVIGPSGSRLTSDVNAFTRRLLGGDGAWPYLDDYLDDDRGDYALAPLSLNATGEQVWTGKLGVANDITVTAVPVHHGPIPAIAYRVDIEDATVVFTGDTTNRHHRIRLLAPNQTQVLVAHHAIARNAGKGARSLHMPPSMIGQLASDIDPDLLVLSHRMRRTLGREVESQREIRSKWRGNLVFAEDFDCFAAVPRARPPAP